MARVKIELLDVVDAEPAVLRLIPREPVQVKEGREAAAYVEVCFNGLRERPAGDTNVRWTQVELGLGGVLTVMCDIMGPQGWTRLAEEVAAKFPAYGLMEVGERVEEEDVEEGNLDEEMKNREWSQEDEMEQDVFEERRVGMLWEAVPRMRVGVNGREVEVGPMRVSRDYVTIDQYMGFIKATGYVPEFERSGEFVFEGSQISSGGKRAGQWPVTRVCLADAEAFAAWVGGRVPSEEELYACLKTHPKKLFKGGHWNTCWTSTRVGNAKAVWLNLAFKEGTKEIAEIGAMRIVKDVKEMDFPFPSFRVVIS
jgi:hypothetical protein